MTEPLRENQPSVSTGTRRSFLGVLLGVASAFVGALLAVPVLRYIFYPVTAASEDAGWTALGAVPGLSGDQTPQRRTLDFKQRDGWRETASEPVVYIINDGGKVKALSAVCPHLGCTVPWDPARKEFVCPCHGGVFSPTGARVSGPPPRAMDSLESKVTGSKLMVKYQYFRPDVPNKQVTS